MWLNFPTNPQWTLKVPSGHIVIKLLGILWKNSKGSFTKYPLGTLWTLRQRTKWVLSKFTHWVLCWVLFESAHHLPAGYEPGELVGTFWKWPILTCWVFRWANWWVLFKCAHYLLAGFVPGKLVGTFWKFPLFTCWVWARQIVSKPTINSQCTHWVNCPLPPVSVKMSAADLTILESGGGQLVLAQLRRRTNPLWRTSFRFQSEYRGQRS